MCFFSRSIFRNLELECSPVSLFSLAFTCREVSLSHEQLHLQRAQKHITSTTRNFIEGEPPLLGTEFSVLWRLPLFAQGTHNCEDRGSCDHMRCMRDIASRSIARGGNSETLGDCATALDASALWRLPLASAIGERDFE